MVVKIEERKKSKKTKKKEIDEIPPFKEIIEKLKENDEIRNHKETIAASGVMELSLQDLMDEYNSLPPQICEWLWCIEYVAKFHQDLRNILDLMNMGYPCGNDYGKRINEILSLRILGFLFDDPKGKNVVDDTDPRIEFDLSSSNVDVLNAILKEIPVSELRREMPELSKFDVLPFISHKNKNLPQCALEKMKELGFLEKNQETMKANDSLLRNDLSKKPIDEVIIIDDSDNDNDDDKKGEVIVINDDDDEDPSECWECCKKHKGTLLICSGSYCEVKVHKECMNCEVDFDDGDFYCSHCLLIRITTKFEESMKQGVEML